VQHNVRSSFEHAFPEEVPHRIQLVSNCTLLGERERAELGAPQGARCSSGPMHYGAWTSGANWCRRVMHVPWRPGQFTGTAFATTERAAAGAVLDTASGALMVSGSEFAMLAGSNLWHSVAMEGLGGSVVVTSRPWEACDPPPQPLRAPPGGAAAAAAWLEAAAHRRNGQAAQRRGSRCGGVATGATCCTGSASMTCAQQLRL
jgi:hypothetical protein